MIGRLNSDEEGRHDKHILECCCDSDWAGKKTRKSTTSVMVFLNSIPIISICRSQQTIALSSCEAEVFAMTAGGAEGKFLKNIWEFLSTESTDHELRSDSSSGRQWLQRSGVGRLKHYETRLLWMQE